MEKAEKMRSNVLRMEFEAKQDLEISKRELLELHHQKQTVRLAAWTLRPICF